MQHIVDIINHSKTSFNPYTYKYHTQYRMGHIPVVEIGNADGGLNDYNKQLYHALKYNPCVDIEMVDMNRIEQLWLDLEQQTCDIRLKPCPYPMFTDRLNEVNYQKEVTELLKTYQEKTGVDILHMYPNTLGVKVPFNPDTDNAQHNLHWGLFHVNFIDQLLTKHATFDNEFNTKESFQNAKETLESYDFMEINTLLENNTVQYKKTMFEIVDALNDLHNIGLQH